MNIMTVPSTKFGAKLLCFETDSSVGAESFEVPRVAVCIFALFNKSAVMLAWACKGQTVVEFAM